MKNTISKNKGYSLIELIIVIAIIAVTASMSFVSITMLNTARAKDAALNFDAEVAELISKNKNMIPDMPNTDPSSSATKSETAKYGLMLYTDDDGTIKFSQIDCDKYFAGSGFYKFKVGSSGGPDFTDTVSVSKRVDVTFQGTYTSFLNGSVETRTSDFTPGAKASTGAVCIMFDSKGNCLSGYGTYKFYKSNGNVVSTVTIRQNGSHEVR
jgi:prepilin-type N-terminal cleavage/methylation domain-containing protein